MLKTTGTCAAALGVLLLGSATAVFAAAGDAPKLDVTKSCEAAVRGAVVVGRNKEACMGDEQIAQDQVTRNWPQYSVGDKTQCVGMVTKGGPPSYVELLACLEVMRDARTIRLNEVEQPLLNKKGQMETQQLTDLGEDASGQGDRGKPPRGQRRKHQQARSP